MKFGVCAVVKNENLYLREWVEHYISLGFDKIIIYDNNENTGEIPNVVIQDYIDKGIVDIHKKYRGIKNLNFINFQASIFSECLEDYKDQLDWIGFFDIDEFLELCDGKTIQKQFSFINYENFTSILVSWCIMGDKDALYYENKPVTERFTQKLEGAYTTVGISLNGVVKSFVRTNRGIKFVTGPYISTSTDICNSGGLKCFVNDECIALSVPNHFCMYLKHYFTKSLSEYLYKNIQNVVYSRTLDTYKSINGWSEKHEELYQKIIKNKASN